MSCPNKVCGSPRFYRSSSHDLEPDIPDDTSTTSAAESKRLALEDLADAFCRHWSDLAPYLISVGIDINADSRRLEEENRSLKLAQAEAQNRPFPVVYPDSSREGSRKLVQRMISSCSVVDYDGFETLISDALSWEEDLASEKLFQFGNIEEIRGLGKSVHSKMFALQLTLIIAAGWYGESRDLKMADINQLACIVDEDTPILVYGIMVALFCRIIKDVPDQLSLEEQMTTSEALILLRVIQFLAGHIRRIQTRSFATIWTGFSTLKSHLKDAMQHKLVAAMFSTLDLLSTHLKETTLVDELRKTTPKLTSETHDFILDGTNLFILGADGSITFVPSAEYQVVVAFAEHKWRVQVDSPVLGILTLDLCDSLATDAVRSVNRVFRPHIRAQRSKCEPDPNKERNICW